MVKAISLKNKTYLKIEESWIKPKRNKRGCEPHRQMVWVTQAGGKKVSEKPPNPRRGTSLKEKLVKAIGLKNKTYLKIERSWIKLKKNKRGCEPHGQMVWATRADGASRTGGWKN